jgi:hypothetical protein
MANQKGGYKRRPRSTKEFTFVIVSAVLGIIVNFFADILISAFPGLLTAITSFFSQFWINIIGVILILVVGILLYLLRERKRVWYGCVEVVFAIAYGLYAINKVETVGYIETISIIAAVYLVVRGIDNIVEGLKPIIAAEGPIYPLS